MAKEIMRSIRLSPYVKGAGPEFRLVLWYTGRAIARCRYPKEAIGYRFSEILANGKRRTIFEGEDYGCSPMHSIDGDESVAGLLNFLTLRKGDTDADYFENYTKRQIAFRDTHAEAVSGEIYRFRDED